MRKNDHEDLLARRLGGGDVARGEPRVSHEPIEAAGHPDGAVKVGKSLRVPLTMFADISALADRRKMSWSALVREWIADGITRDAADDVDPVQQLHHSLDAATRALHALENRTAA